VKISPASFISRLTGSVIHGLRTRSRGVSNGATARCSLSSVCFLSLSQCLPPGASVLNFSQLRKPTSDYPDGQEYPSDEWEQQPTEYPYDPDSYDGSEQQQPIDDSYGQDPYDESGQQPTDFPYGQQPSNTVEEEQPTYKNPYFKKIPKSN